MEITVNAKTLAGNMGDGWHNNNAANEAYAKFLEIRLTEAIRSDYPDADISVSIDAIADAGGDPGSPSVWVDDDDNDIAIDASTQIAELAVNEIHDSWSAWCDSNIPVAWMKDGSSPPDALDWS